jgi:putative NIF3 family GTP cyclohydrolase 1 type 2
MLKDVSRREFLALAGAAAASPAWLDAGAAALRQGATVQDVMARVLERLPGVTTPNPVDGLKAGRPDLVVKGIATTAIASADAIRRAVDRGRNLVITLEPTFYARADAASPANRATDAVFAAKRALIADSDVAVWRLRDRWLARRPDPLIEGLVEKLDWKPYQSPAAPDRVVLPETTLREVAAHVERRLGARSLRVVGAQDLRVSRIVLSPGPSAPAITFGNLATADLILAGEPREWEGVEYVQDTITAGGAKAMILAGRLLTEDPGMRVMADWLTSLLPGPPVEWLPVSDPYWRPIVA